MKPAALLFFGLLVTAPYAALSEVAEGGAITLNPAQMDGITAGSSTLPVAIVGSASSGTGNLVLTGTDALALVTAHPVSVQFGVPLGYVTATRGTATVTALGGDSSRSTSIATSADPTPSPFALTIDKTVQVLGTQIQVYSSVAPGGIMVDWFAHQLNSL